MSAGISARIPKLVQSAKIPLVRLSQLRMDLFTSTMGTVGIGLTWRAASEVIGAPVAIGELILLAGGILYLVLLALQFLRFIMIRQSVIEEWRSPPAFMFFSAATISGLLLALAALPYSAVLANCIWWPATIAQLVLLFAAMRRWIIRPHNIADLGPTWLIPMVGNASPAFAGIALGHVDLSRALLMSAILCWLVFQPLILFRVVFAEPKLPPVALPSLNIMVSAPAVIAIASWMTFGKGNFFSEFMTYCALFFAISIATLGRRLVEAPFSRRWWGFTFPMAALSSALIRLSDVRPGAFTMSLAVAGLTIATIVVAGIATRSLRYLTAPLASAAALEPHNKEQDDATI
ncbi:C4-dicarboxylate transporter [bacterium M00.F.Ca.ET.194.01.1.1]|nr:C4-dicarboxylate transporter [bacterium M00.F.Ca.ET.194.01.1.1]TGS52173.1 C4-dicarboxylate transporter [bacterium M00.F.Ca.ET.179.01.1.1]TGV43321.1 C4-dicarboxylate transporter [bacterium M00.F.Ca.ET.168.01.1.1]